MYEISHASRFLECGILTGTPIFSFSLLYYADVQGNYQSKEQHHIYIYIIIIIITIILVICKYW